MAVVDNEVSRKPVGIDCETPLIGDIERNFVSPIQSNSVTQSAKDISERIPAFGLILTLLSVIIMSFQSVIVKQLTGIHAIQIMLFRFAIQSIVFFIAAIISQHSLMASRETRIYLILRCIIGTIGVTALFMSYKLLPIADAATILYTSPVFVTVFAYFLLKESITLIQIITCLFTLVGVVIVSKPEFILGKEEEKSHERHVEGIMLAMTASLSSACVAICVKKSVSIPVSVQVMWFAITVSTVSSIVLYIIEAFVWPTHIKTWVLLFSSGMCGVGAHYFATKAYQYENAGPISVTKSFSIVLAFLWEVVLLHESVQWTSIAGATIIMCSILTLTVNKWRK